MRSSVPVLLRSVLWVSLFSMLGCYRSHAVGFECDCCGTTLILGAPAMCTAEACAPICASVGDAGRDAGRDASGGASDAGVTGCGPRPLDLLCFDHVRAGVPNEVAITLALSDGECFCEQALTCEATITGPRELALRTALCPEMADCRACGGPPTGTCTLPAMEVGTWHVTVNGEDALDLLVSDVLPEPANVCVRRAVIDSCGANWDPAGLFVGRACYPSAAPGESPVEIQVFDSCGGCVQRGPCEVVVMDDVIRVRATRLSNACDLACPPSCEPDEHRCFTPPLPPGSYRVEIEGLSSDEPPTIEVGPGLSGPETCVGD